jgi:transposase InsO family protein
MDEYGLLHKRRYPAAELYQAAKLYELRPKGPNELWQMDVTYVHIPGYGWRYAMTVIDYYSRYLLACHLTNSFGFDRAVPLGLRQPDSDELPGGPILVRLSIRATPPCALWRSCARCSRGHATIRLSSGNLTQKRPKIFYLNSVPRQTQEHTQ